MSLTVRELNCEHIMFFVFKKTLNTLVNMKSPRSMVTNMYQKIPHVHSADILTVNALLLTQWASQFRDASHAWFHGISIVDKHELTLCGHFSKTKSKKFLWLCVQKAYAVKRPLIPQLTLEWHLNQHSINISINTWSKPDWYFTWESVKNQLIFPDTPLSFDWCIGVGQHSSNYWPTVHWVLIKMSILGQSSVIAWDVDQVSINQDVNGVLILSVNWHLTVDTFSTYDPVPVQLLGLLCTPTRTSCIPVPTIVTPGEWWFCFSRAVYLIWIDKM